MASRVWKAFNIHFVVLVGIGWLQFGVLGGFVPDAWARPEDKKPAVEIQQSAAENPWRVVREGVAIEMSTPGAVTAKTGPRLLENRDAKIRFTLKDSNTGEPLRGLFPAAWMDKQNERTLKLSCKDKVRSYLQARMGFQPAVDLNSWYILALNNRGSISVINPLIDTGNSGMLLDLVTLEGRGEAWTLGPRSDRLYVTLPELGKVAVIDTDTWKVTGHVPVGPGAGQLGFQPDGRYLWVAVDSGVFGPQKTGGVVAIDPENMQVVSSVPTGFGRHEMAFSEDSRNLYVTNESDGTVSVVDIWKFRKTGDIQGMGRPTSLAFSRSAQALFVTDAEKGRILRVDPKKNQVTAEIQAEAGVTGLQFSPDGRWGFVSNPNSKDIVIFDSAGNQKAHSFKIGNGPNQVVFSRTYAYIHSVGSSQMSVVNLEALVERGSIPVIQIPVGKNPSKEMSASIQASMIALTPEESSVVIANPVEENIFYYMEGMNAPMGSFQNFQRMPKAVMTVDKGLKERLPGEYEAHIRVTDPGTYDVAFLLDNPKVSHCFTVEVEDDPTFHANRPGELDLEWLNEMRTVNVGQPVDLRVRLKQSGTGKPKSGVKDLQMKAVLMPGLWQESLVAEPMKEGEYSLKFTFPRPGIYLLSFKSWSQSVPGNRWFPLRIRAEAVKASDRAADPGKK